MRYFRIIQHCHLWCHVQFLPISVSQSQMMLVDWQIDSYSFVFCPQRSDHKYNAVTDHSSQPLRERVKHLWMTIFVSRSLLCFGLLWPRFLWSLSGMCIDKYIQLLTEDNSWIPQFVPHYSLSEPLDIFRSRFTSSRLILNEVLLLVFVFVFTSLAYVVFVGDNWWWPSCPVCISSIVFIPKLVFSVWTRP